MYYEKLPEALRIELEAKKLSYAVQHDEILVDADKPVPGFPSVAYELSHVKNWFEMVAAPAVNPVPEGKTEQEVLEDLANNALMSVNS